MADLIKLKMNALANYLISQWVRMKPQIYEQRLKNSWLYVKGNPGGSVNYDFIQYIPFLDPHTYYNGPSVFRNTVKQSRVIGPLIGPFVTLSKPGTFQHPFICDLADADFFPSAGL